MDRIEREQVRRFGRLQRRDLRVGLAAAVAIDAFVLRTVLVPALMHLFGRANWWLPDWLDRVLPHLSVEPADDEDFVEPPALAGSVV